MIDVDEANWGGEDLAGYRLVATGDDGAWRVADAEFVAHARQDVPALLAFARDALTIRRRTDLGHTTRGYNKALDDVRDAAARHLGGEQT